MGAASTPGPWCPRSNQFGGRVHFWPANRLLNHLIGDPALRSLIGSLLAFTRPIFPLPGSPVWFGSALGFTPLLSHASLPGACRGQGQDWTLSRAVTTSHVYSIWFRVASRRTSRSVTKKLRNNFGRRVEAPKRRQPLAEKPFASANGAASASAAAFGLSARAASRLADRRTNPIALDRSAHRGSSPPLAPPATDGSSSVHRTQRITDPQAALAILLLEQERDIEPEQGDTHEIPGEVVRLHERDTVQTVRDRDAVGVHRLGMRQKLVKQCQQGRHDRLLRLLERWRRWRRRWWRRRRRRRW